MRLSYKHTRFACYFAAVTSAIVNNFTPLLFAVLSDEFGITLEELGLLVTVNFVVQICMDLVGAKFADKIGYRRVMLLSQSLQAVGFLLLGILPFVFENHYVGLMISAVLYAMGSGFNEVIRSPIFEALPSDDKSSKMSFMHSFYCWGSMLVIIMSTLYFAVFGIENWRYLAFIWAGFSAIGALMFVKVPIVTLCEEAEVVPTGKLFSMKLFWVLVVLMICSGAAELSMSQWSSMFVEKGLGISKTLGDIIGPCMFAFSMGLSRLFYGKFGNRIDLIKFIMFSSALCILSYIMTAAISNSIIAIIGCALCGFSVGIMWPGVTSLAAHKCPEGGTPMFGYLAMAGDIGCSAGPGIVGFIASAVKVSATEYDSLRAGLLSVAVFPIIMLVFVIIMKKMSLTNDK